jgi:NADH:ubiquinone oxidoreductase subunit E
MTTGSEGIKERANKALTSQEQGTVTLLSSLLAVQDELGYIPEEAIEEVARFTQYTINDVWGVASFYPNFRFTPPGVHSVELCWGPSCHIVGAMPVVKAALETLGLNDEGDTPDGRVTVRYNTCLGACSQGPVISIDHELIGRASPDMVREMMLSLGDAQQGVHEHSQQPSDERK